MSYITREFIGFTVTQNYNNLRQVLIDAGWELFETISVSNHVYRSNCEDGLGPYIYLNITFSTNVTAYYYSYWTAGTGVCPLSSGETVISSVNTPVIRIYCNKNILLILGSPFSGYTGRIRTVGRYLRIP